mgnify:CR=1 FL=1
MEARNSSFEILRLVAMFIIICHHFVVYGIYPFAPPTFMIFITFRWLYVYFCLVGEDI